jgi:hypothetical protein
MPRKRKGNAPHPRANFGALERMHLLHGICAPVTACALCFHENRKNTPCERPLDIAIARSVWQQHRAELLREWNATQSTGFYESASGVPFGWGWLAPRIPCFAEVFFDGVPMPMEPDPSWPEPAVREWGLIGCAVHDQRAYALIDPDEWVVLDHDKYAAELAQWEHFADAMNARTDELMAQEEQVEEQEDADQS